MSRQSDAASRQGSDRRRRSLGAGVPPAPTLRPRSGWRHPGAAELPAYCLGWNAIERAEMVKASEKHMPSSAPWFFSDGKIASTIFTEPQA
jgi:hypothetical protein